MRAVLGLLGLAAAAVGAAEPVVTVGAALPLSGAYAQEADAYRKGLVLWQEEVNAAGGLLGRRVELRLLDDRSAAGAAPELYRQLVETHGAQLLVGPFGSAATLGAASVADRAGRVLINATGAARSVQRRAYRFVFHLAAPYSRYAAGVLAVAREQQIRSMVILASRDPAAREPAEWLRDEARGLGIAVGEIVNVATGTRDFTATVAQARGAGVQAWIAFGAPHESAEMVKALKRADFAPPLVVLQGAAQAEFIGALGQDAEAVLGIAAYHPARATPGNARFTSAYRARWSADPGLAAAQGYAAGQLLEQAVRRSGSLDAEQIRAALAALEGETLLGRFRLDPRSGTQLGLMPALTQIQAGTLAFVWPAAYATAQARLPYPAWASRRPIRPAGPNLPEGPDHGAQ